MELGRPHVLITGASSGLGAAVVERFAHLGYQISACARRLEELNDVAAKNTHFSGQIKTYAVDVSSWEQVKDAVESMVQTTGLFTGAIHCAGTYGPFGDIEQVDSQHFAEAIQVNLIGTFNIAKALTHQFNGNRCGFIVLSGGGATKPMPNVSSYAASKAAVVRLIETLSLEKSYRNVSIVALAPGLMRTPMLEQVLSAGPLVVGSDFYQEMLRADAEGRDSKGQAIDFLVAFIQNPISNLSGKLVSAVWDPWQEWLIGESCEKLSGDGYTLRRVT